MKVIIMQGASGSGKSTYVSKLKGEFRVCSADHFFMVDGEYKFDPSKLGEAHAACMFTFLSSCETALNAPNFDAIIVDNTNSTCIEMAPYVAVAKAYGFEIEIVRCIAAGSTCAERNTHGVPPGACVRMAHNLEDPLPFWPVTLTKVYTGPERLPDDGHSQPPVGYKFFSDYAPHLGYIREDLL